MLFVIEGEGGGEENLNWFRIVKSNPYITYHSYTKLYKLTRQFHLEYINIFT